MTIERTDVLIWTWLAGCGTWILMSLWQFFNQGCYEMVDILVCCYIVAVVVMYGVMFIRFLLILFISFLYHSILRISFISPVSGFFHLSFFV